MEKMMRTDIDAMRDMNSAPYFDMTGNKILPGQILMVYEGEPFGGIIRIKDGDVMFNETLLDDILAETENVAVIGWVQ
jgi:hypothetical protein